MMGTAGHARVRSSGRELGVLIGLVALLVAPSVILPAAAVEASSIASSSGEAAERSPSGQAVTSEVTPASMATAGYLAGAIAVTAVLGWLWWMLAVRKRD